MPRYGIKKIHFPIQSRSTRNFINSFDIIPNCYFALVKDSLLDLAFSKADNLELDCGLSAIGTAFAVTQKQLFNKAEELYGVQVRSIIVFKS